MPPSSAINESPLLAVNRCEAAIPLSAMPGHGLDVWFPVGTQRKRTVQYQPVTGLRPRHYLSTRFQTRWASQSLLARTRALTDASNSTVQP